MARLSAILLCLGAPVLLLPTAAVAAPGDECVGKSSPADEIACLRRALAESHAELDRNRSGETPSGRATNPLAPVSAPVSISDQVAAPVPASAGQPPAPRVTEQPTPAPVARQAAEAPRPAAPAPSIATRQSEPELGAEQLAGGRARPAETQVVHAMILSNNIDAQGLFTFELDNGQRWKQVERPTIQIFFRKGRTYSAEISRSGFGGYRMSIPDFNRTIVVTRLK